MTDEVTEYAQVGELRLDDESILVFASYSLGTRRLGSVRIYREGRRYAGPTRAGFDMQLHQLEQLVPMLQQLSQDLDSGAIRPPAETGRIPIGKTAEWVVSLLEPDEHRDEAALDIRKYVSSRKFCGWTRKGLRIGIHVLDAMLPLLQALSNDLASWREGRSGLLPQGTATDRNADSTTEEPPLAVPPEYKDLF